MNSIFLILWSRLSLAITTVPDLDDRGIAMVTIAYAFFTLVLGNVSRFLIDN